MDYGAWRFNAAYTKPLTIIPILTRINPILRIDNNFLRSTLIMSSHLRLGLPKWLFPVGLAVKILNTPIFLHSLIDSLKTFALNRYHVQRRHNVPQVKNSGGGFNLLKLEGAISNSHKGWAYKFSRT